MNIYRLTLDTTAGLPDERYISAIVVAENVDLARVVHPGDGHHHKYRWDGIGWEISSYREPWVPFEKSPFFRRTDSGWSPPANVTAEYLGKAHSTLPAGVLMCIHSYHGLD